MNFTPFKELGSRVVTATRNAAQSDAAQAARAKARAAGQVIVDNTPAGVKAQLVDAKAAVYGYLENAPEHFAKGQASAKSLASQAADRVPPEVLERTRTAGQAVKGAAQTGYSKLPEGARAKVETTATQARAAAHGARPSVAYVDTSTAAVTEARDAWQTAYNDYASGRGTKPERYTSPQIVLAGLKGRAQRAMLKLPHVKKAAAEIADLQSRGGAKYLSQPEAARLAELTEKYPYLRTRGEVVRSVGGDVIVRHPRLDYPEAETLEVPVKGPDGKVLGVVVAENNAKHSMYTVERAPEGADWRKIVGTRDELHPGSTIDTHHASSVGNPTVAEMRAAGFHYEPWGAYDEARMMNAELPEVVEAKPDLRYADLGDTMNAHLEANMERLQGEHPKVFTLPEDPTEARTAGMMRLTGKYPHFNAPPAGANA